MEIYTHDFAKLEYIDDYDDFVCNKSEYIEKLGYDKVLELLSNTIIVNEISSISTKLNIISSWIYWLQSVQNSSIVTHDEILEAINTIKIFHLDIVSEYQNSLNKEGVWKYIDKSINDLYIYLNDNNDPDPSLKEICNIADFYTYLNSFKKEQ